MKIPQLDRFLPYTAADQDLAESDRRAKRQRHESAEYSAYTAMSAGIPDLVVDRTHNANTLADVLSSHTLNYRFAADGSNPAMLLAKLLADALQRKCPHAEAYAKRIAFDYAVSREEVA